LAAHVLINALLLNTEESYRGAGVSNYSQNLLAALGRAQLQDPPGLTITALIQDAHFRTPGIDLVNTGVLPGKNAVARIFWEQTGLPLLLKKRKADLVHGLVNVLPLATNVPGVVTVHDLSFLRMPEKFPAAKRFYLSKMCPASVAKARRVIAVSTQTADDLIHFFNTEAEKVDIVYNGVESRFSPGQTKAIEAFRAQKGLPDRFLFYLGTLEPRKNLVRLVEAYKGWRAQARSADKDVKLVIAGGKGWFYKQIFQLVQELGLTEHVLFPGFIPRQELPDWYRAAEVFVYPSLFEGFGLPVVEAMACGTPVVCSHIPCLLEVARDAALTFPAENTDELIAAINLMVTQPAVRAEMRQRGLIQARRFSWERAAQETVAVYEKALSGRVAND
jgi:glycosyltransferase involved in cell wall biosynthesis